jgi:hypothetical protein
MSHTRGEHLTWPKLHSWFYGNGSHGFVQRVCLFAAAVYHCHKSAVLGAVIKETLYFWRIGLWEL